MPQLIEEHAYARPPATNDSSDEENWEEEDEIDGVATVCLFCAQEFKNIQPLALDHLRAAHSVDLTALKGHLNMDQYSFIRVSKSS